MGELAIYVPNGVEVGNRESTELLENGAYCGKVQCGVELGRGEEAQENSVVGVREAEITKNELCEGMSGS